MAAKKKIEEESKETMRRKLQEQTEAFLRGGGKIQQIPTGQSGQDAVKPGAKHIRLNNSGSKSGS